jgi:hypothetical protein
MLVKIEEENSFKKNMVNKSLVNTDLVALKEYKNRKTLNNKVNGINEEINIMKSDIAEIKSLLHQLVKSN